MPALIPVVSKAELDTLNYERYHYPDPLVQKRLYAVYLKASLNFSYRTIGIITGLHPNRVAHWVKVYQNKAWQPSKPTTKELSPAIEAAKAGQIHLLFCDAAHFV